jgi:hypothetical protein
MASSAGDQQRAAQPRCRRGGGRCPGGSVRRGRASTPRTAATGGCSPCPMDGAVDPAPAARPPGRPAAKRPHRPAGALRSAPAAGRVDRSHPRRAGRPGLRERTRGATTPIKHPGGRKLTDDQGAANLCTPPPAVRQSAAPRYCRPSSWRCGKSASAFGGLARIFHGHDHLDGRRVLVPRGRENRIWV